MTDTLGEDWGYNADAAAAKEKALREQGYSVGLSQQNVEGGQGSRSDVIKQETSGDRYINMQTNYAYGGTPGGAQAAIDQARNTSAQYGAPISKLAGREMAQGQYAQFRDTPTTDFSQSNAARGQALASYNALMAQARAPQGPSVAQQQLALGTAQAQANQLALSHSGGGMGDTASAGRNAAWANANIATQGANQSQILKAQEDAAFRQRQLAAYGQASQLASGLREQDVGQAQYGTQAELASRGINDTAGLGYGNVSLEGYNAAGRGAMNTEQLANQINSTALTGTMGYENNIANYYLGRKKDDDSWGDTGDWAQLALAGGGAVGGFVAGGPAGAAAGGAAGYELGGTVNKD